MSFVKAIAKVQMFVSFFCGFLLWGFAILGWLLMAANEYIPVIFSFIYGMFYVGFMVPAWLSVALLWAAKSIWNANPAYILLIYFGSIVFARMVGPEYIEKWLTFETSDEESTLKGRKYPKFKYPTKASMLPIVLFSYILGFLFADYTGALSIIYETSIRFQESLG